MYSCNMCKAYLSDLRPKGLGGFLDDVIVRLPRKLIASYNHYRIERRKLDNVENMFATEREHCHANTAKKHEMGAAEQRVVIPAGRRNAMIT